MKEKTIEPCPQRATGRDLDLIQALAMRVAAEFMLWHGKLNHAQEYLKTVKSLAPYSKTSPQFERAGAEALSGAQDAVAKYLHLIDLLSENTELILHYAQELMPNEWARCIHLREWIMGQAVETVDAEKLAGELARLAGYFSHVQPPIRQTLALLTCPQKSENDLTD